MYPPCPRLLQPDVSTCQIIYRKDSGCCMLVLVLVLVARPVWSGTAAPTGPGLLRHCPLLLLVMLGGVAHNMCAAVAGLVTAQLHCCGAVAINGLLRVTLN